MQVSDIGSFYNPMSIGFVARCNWAHFLDNLDLAAQFAYFRRPESLFGPYSIKNGSLFD